MCGIAGILRFDDAPIDRAPLDRMLAALSHRGPDGQGILINGRCGLAHARLSILDHAGGAQPMSAPHCDACRGLTVVFNGEIYNHRALREELRAAGHVFTSDHSDTEVILHGYRQWGRDLPKRLEGMFALAVWDANRRQLFLARDRSGKKPLWLRTTPQGIQFASVMAALVAGDNASTWTIDPSALRYFLRLGYTDEHSLIAGIAELPPAHWLVCDATGRTERGEYWSLPPHQAPDPCIRYSLDPNWDSEFHQLLRTAVASRLEADVPLGCFLSGGIDSSLVAALAQEELKSRGAAPLRTFSVAMPHSDYDESPFARAVAQHIGTQHTELRATPGSSLIDDLARLTALSGEPTADSSILPTHWVSAAARQHVKVALSGDGGDELFGGYDRYRAMRILDSKPWLRHVPIGPFRSSNPRSRRARLARLFDAARQLDHPRRYASMIHLFDEHMIRALGAGDATVGNTTYAAVDQWPDVRDERDHPEPVRAAMRWDFRNYLVHDLLRKVDRASMAVALEVRCPLLDRTVVESTMSMWTRLLLPWDEPKGLLRGIARKLLPPAIAKRPKRGFAIPIGQWFRGELRTPLHEQLLEGSLERLSLQRVPIERMLAEHMEEKVDHTHRLFALLSLSLWAQWLWRR